MRALFKEVATILLIVGFVGTALFLVEHFSGRINNRSRWADLSKYQFAVVAATLCSGAGFISMLIALSLR